MMNGHDKILRLADFSTAENDYSCNFVGYLSGRSAFVQRWKELKYSGN